MNDIVFITGAGRSGTNLIAGIYDNHERVNVFPGEFPFYNILSKINSNSCIISNNKNKKLLLEFFIKRFNKDRKKFKKQLNFKKYNKFHLSFLINKVSNFYFKKKKIILINTQHENIDFLLNNFKKAKIIHMLRNPLTQINSRYLLRHGDCSKRYGGDEFPISFFRSYNTFKQAYRYQNDPRVLIIKLEDLTKNNEPVIKKINNFLKVKKKTDKIKLTRFNGKFISTINGRYIETEKIINIKSDYSCLLPNDLYCINKIKHAKYFYRIKKFNFSRPNIYLYFLRHFGFIGKKRKLTFNFIDLAKLFFYTIKNYKTDKKVKIKFLNFAKNEK